MRTIHEILTLMYREYVKDINPDYPAETLNHSGLCNVLWTLWWYGKITIEESDIAEEYLYKNKPKNLFDNDYFWAPWVRRYRLLWMEKHMAIQNNYIK